MVVSNYGTSKQLFHVAIECRTYYISTVYYYNNNYNKQMTHLLLCFLCLYHSLSLWVREKLDFLHACLVLTAFSFIYSHLSLKHFCIIIFKKIIIIIIYHFICNDFSFNIFLCNYAFCFYCDRQIDCQTILMENWKI